MNRLLGALALVASVTLSASPATAASSFVQDGAGMFSADAIAPLATRLAAFNAQTKKEVVVITVPSLPAGQTVQQAADAAFAAQSINGTLIYVAQNEHKIFVLPGKNEAAAGWFTADGSAAIVADMSAQFKAGNNDAALTAGVNDVLNIYRSHVNGSGSSSSTGTAASSGVTIGGVHFQMWWIIFAIVAFIIIRTLSRPRYYGPPGGVAPGPQGGMPMGYGGGYGGGGGGFWSGLLGGLGGAWLGNEMFRGGSGGIGGIGGGNDAGGTSGPGDAGGWANDAGQSGDSGSAGGDWGGGGWGGGGGGDFGGGGGGGGDSGGAGGGW